MQNSTKLKIERLKSLAAVSENEHNIRELVSEILSLEPEKSNARLRTLCLNKLRQLENRKCLETEKCEYGFVELSSLIKSLCLCSDVLLSDSACKIQAEIEPTLCSCCPRIIIDGFLNLISNAAKFSQGGGIYVTLKNCGDFVFIAVENDGTLRFDLCPPSLGIKAAENSARLHGGVLMYSSSNSSVRAGFSVSTGLMPSRKYDLPLFSDLLTDEFSCVHIGLSDVEGQSSFFL